MIIPLRNPNTRFQPGDAIVFRKQKRSAQPGPRATDIRPDRFGDQYTYMVEKYWIVESVTDDGQVVARTRTGKTHTLDPADPRLHRARWWDKLIHGRRFPEPKAADTRNDASA